MSSSVLGIALAVAGVSSSPAVRAQERRPAEKAAEVKDDKKVSFDAAIRRIRAAAESGEWRREGWKDAAIDGAVAALVNDVRRATGDAAVTVPVTLADVAPVPEAGAGRGRVVKGLIVGRGNVSTGFVEESIILADGNARLSFATNCVVVARGAVAIAHGSGNVVIAGHYVHVSHDGNRMGGGGGGGGANRPSVLVSGAMIDVSHAKRTVCSAPQLVRVGHADGVRFVNAPTVEAGSERQAPNPQIAAAGPLAAAPAPGPNALDGKLNVTQVVADGNRGGMVVLEKGGVEWVLRPEAAVADAAGKPIAGLGGWMVTFLEDDFALFSNNEDGRDAGFLRPRR